MSRHFLSPSGRHLSITSRANLNDATTLFASNGFSLPLTADTGTKWVEDADGNFMQSPADTPAMPGCRLTDGVWYPTDSEGADLYTVDRLIRTPQGSVKQYDVTYPGVMVEPAATNYLLNSDTPATQTTGSLSAGDYILWVVGTGSAAVTAGTATITGGGTATDGTPDLFTVTGAGTVTVTVTGDLDFLQLEAGSFVTSRIPTTASTVTRPADNISFPTPAWLLAHPNDFAVIQRVIPLANSGSYPSTKFLFSIGESYANKFSLYLVPPTTYVIGKSITGVSTLYTTIGKAATKGNALEFIIYSSATAGIGFSYREYTSSWSAYAAFSTITTNDAKLNIAVSQHVSIGSKIDGGTFMQHYFATYPMTRILRIPTGLNEAGIQAWLKAEAEGA